MLLMNNLDPGSNHRIERVYTFSPHNSILCFCSLFFSSLSPVQLKYVCLIVKSCKLSLLLESVMWFYFCEKGIWSFLHTLQLLYHTYCILLLMYLGVFLESISWKVVSNMLSFIFLPFFVFYSSILSDWQCHVLTPRSWTLGWCPKTGSLNRTRMAPMETHSKLSACIRMISLAFDWHCTAEKDTNNKRGAMWPSSIKTRRHLVKTCKGTYSGLKWNVWLFNEPCTLTVLTGWKQLSLLDLHTKAHKICF